MSPKRIGILSGLAVLSLVVAHAGAQEAAAKKEPAPSPNAAGLQVGPAGVAKHWSKNAYPESVPEGQSYYLVVKDDTLWDVAKRFLGSPYLWPQVWDQNKYITDAHWIYPGDPIVFSKVAVIASQAGQPGGLGAEETISGEAATAPGDTRARQLPPGSVLYPVSEEDTVLCSHSIAASRDDQSLNVVGSEGGSIKVAYGAGEIVYLSKGGNAGVRAGDRYIVRHTAYSVKHPKTGDGLGTKLDTKGVVRVILVQPESATAVIDQSCTEMYAGDYLTAYVKPNVPLILRHDPPTRLTPPTGKTRGYVVDVADNVAAAGAGHFVSIDLGTAAGVVPGALFTVFRIEYPDAAPNARNVLGELAVLTVREGTATAKIIGSNGPILVGDEIELR